MVLLPVLTGLTINTHAGGCGRCGCSGLCFCDGGSLTLRMRGGGCDSGSGAARRPPRLCERPYCVPLQPIFKSRRLRGCANGRAACPCNRYSNQGHEGPHSACGPVEDPECVRHAATRPWRPSVLELRQQQGGGVRSEACSSFGVRSLQPRAQARGLHSSFSQHRAALIRVWARHGPPCGHRAGGVRLGSLRN